jgi:hypothetical protein
VLQLNVRMQELEIDDIALHALRTKLNKDRILSNDERVKMASSSFSSTFSPAVPNTALAKVQSRLLSSKTLASAVAGLLDDLRTVLNPPTKDAEGSESSEDEDDDDELASSALPTARKKKAMPQPVLSDEEAVDDDGWESGTVHDSDSGHEDNTGEEPEASDQLEHEDRQSLVGSEASDDESDSGSVAAPPPKKARQEKKKAGPAESTFLPSLAVGFTRGDSDSEWSDSEAKIADGVHKNRRGQRARRAWVFSRGVSLFRVDIVPSASGRRSMARTQRTSRSSGRSLLRKKTNREVSGLSTAAGRKLALNHNHGQRRRQGLIGQIKDPLGRRQPLPVCLILLL